MFHFRLMFEGLVKVTYLGLAENPLIDIGSFCFAPFSDPNIHIDLQKITLTELGAGMLAGGINIDLLTLRSETKTFC